jgi:hypothetical protein
MRPRRASTSRGIVRSSSRRWGGSDVRSVSPADRDRGRGRARRRRYRSFSRRRRPTGIVRDFSPGCIVRCRREGPRSAARANHAGPSPLARSSLPRRPVTSTLTSTSLEAVVVAAPPFIRPLLFLPPATSPLYPLSPSPSVSPPLPRHGHFRHGGHRRRHPPVARRSRLKSAII